MKLTLFILSLFALVSCQDFNSNTTDKIKYSDMIEDPLDPNFGPAYQVITKRCINCHSSSQHSAWTNLLTTQAWIDDGIYVNPGDEKGSMLLQRTVVYRSLYGGSGDMPPDLILPIEEYNIMKKWICEMEGGSC